MYDCFSKEDLVEVAHLALGKQRVVALWGKGAMTVIRRNVLHRTGRSRKFRRLPFVRLKGNQRRTRFLKFLLEKGVSILDCILFARILPSEIIDLFKEYSSD